MQHLASPRARITPRDTYYKAVDPNSGLGLRACNPRPRLDRLDVCTWFRSREEAEQLLAARFPTTPFEIERFDL